MFQGSGAGGQRSGIRGQGSGLRIKGKGARDQKSEVGRAEDEKVRKKLTV